MASDRSDEELLRSFLDGNQTSFAELMTRHEERIFSLAYRMTGDRSDALDATQEAFVSAFRQAHRFRFDSAFGTWLYRIAMNLCIDKTRRQKRLKSMPEGRRARIEETSEKLSARVSAAFRPMITSA